MNVMAHLLAGAPKHTPFIHTLERGQKKGEFCPLGRRRNPGARTPAAPGILAPMSTSDAPGGSSPATAPTTARRRPGWLTAFAIAAIVVGAMKLVSAASSLATSGLIETQQGLLDRFQPPGTANPVRQLQRDTSRQMMQLTATFAREHRGLLIGGGAAGLLLILGGAGCLTLRPRFRQVLLAAFLATMAVDLAIVPDEVKLQRATGEATAELTAKMAATTGQRNVAALDTMAAISRATKTMTLVMTVGWMVARVIFCAGGFVYLSREPVRLLFDGADARRATVSAPPPS
jgi:hypothetical protein